jgi:formyl-CoA transferase/CoA:oxalate CoA-transferase
VGPLEGIVVLDLSRVLAGPFATQLLGDMGAVVLKVEEPGQGDESRAFAPPFWGGESTYYLSANRSKRSLALNLKAPEGRDIVRRLAGRADVLIENFRPGTAERLGLGYEDMAALNPRLIYVSVSGFGQTGPERARPGYDLLAQAMGGIMSLTGPPEGPPYKVGISQADLVAGLYAVIGTLLGLLARERTGQGQRVDTCLLDTQLALMTFVAMAYFATGQPPRRMGNEHASIAPYEVHQARDGFFVLAVGSARNWTRLCEVLERPDLARDPRFATNADRVAHRARLTAVLEPIFRARTVGEWMELFDGAGIPAGPILSIPQILAHPQVAAREMVLEMEHPTIGTMKALGHPIKLSRTPARAVLPPPLLGQHTAEILEEFLGLSPEEVAALEARGVVRCHPAVGEGRGTKSSAPG